MSGMKRELRVPLRRAVSLVNPGNSIAYWLVGRRPPRKEASR